MGAMVLVTGPSGDGQDTLAWLVHSPFRAAQDTFPRTGGNPRRPDTSEASDNVTPEEFDIRETR